MVLRLHFFGILMLNLACCCHHTMTTHIIQEQEQRILLVKCNKKSNHITIDVLCQLFLFIFAILPKIMYRLTVAHFCSLMFPAMLAQLLILQTIAACTFIYLFISLLLCYCFCCSVPFLRTNQNQLEQLKSSFTDNSEINQTQMGSQLHSFLW